MQPFSISSVLLALLLTGAGAYAQEPPSNTLWTNFEWEPAGDYILSLADSTSLPLIEGFEAIVIRDGRYTYYSNLDDGSMVFWRPGDAEPRTRRGNLAFNETGGFFYYTVWRHGQIADVRVVSADGTKMIHGECVGFNGFQLYVRNAISANQVRPGSTHYGQEGVIPELYDYSLQPSSDDVEEPIECHVFPTS